MKKLWNWIKFPFLVLFVTALVLVFGDPLNEDEDDDDRFPPCAREK